MQILWPGYCIIYIHTYVAMRSACVQTLHTLCTYTVLTNGAMAAYANDERS